ncbi:hypothetical protein BDV27DRAFT_164246 [Aspergillus caelatus]|uniref:EH domain-containing protein n=1 Tax=Aspergillus caelatus TaxID=61420 RepID=A0A5N6ZKJ3_9EURO|nr:uncharacterized protein BDV27DRAFT_164246 [Aspergillus caelatus]KAE8357733.1 hypothetical protein BDV27DRAFT_164246 [Aspergillus caelatus]
MANSTPAPNQRVAPHLSPGHVHNAVTALQGATTAFRTSASRSNSPAVAHRTGGAADINSYDLGPGPRPDLEAEVPPEVGSVKDKIGRYTAHSQNALESVRKSPATFRPESPQQIAARFAAEHVPVHRKNAATTTDTSGVIRGTNGHQPKNDNNVRDVKAFGPSSAESVATNNNPIGRHSQGEEAGPTRDLSIRRKPIIQPPNTPLDSTQHAVAKSRPIPPAPRKSRLVTGGPGSAEPATRSGQPSELKASLEPLSSCSFGPSEDLSTSSNEKAPVLPPRPGGSPTPNGGLSNHRALLVKNGVPSRSLSPTASSIYDRRHNSSTPSVLDDSTSLSEGALSDAIVASSLASSRAPPTRKGPPPPPPHRQARSRSILRFHNNGREFSQSRSPSSPLRHTLRNPAKSDDEDDSHHRHRTHIIRKHPHKHHEGDRKRWRSELTEKERKRYEGVWAANKGLLVPTKEEVDRQCSEHDPLRDIWPSNTSEMVVNIVVRDIWSRSRLQSFVLEQIWDLVDTQKIGLLTKEEFVVGMWLIDQQLKGHKLPVKVPDSVWGSVKRVPGISLRDIDFHS